MLVLCLCLLGVPVATAGEPPGWYASTAGSASRQHPLIGTIYSESKERPEILASSLLAVKRTDRGRLWRPKSPQSSKVFLPPGIVLLGEVHDNPEHHRLRGWLMAETLRAQPKWRPGVVFEQISEDQQAALDRYRAAPRGSPPSAADLLRDLQWDKSGWPAAELYRPLFDAVVSRPLPLYAGNAPKDRVRAVARGGMAVLAPEERARLRLELSLPASLADALSGELLESHCGALPPQAIPGMAAAQRYRDASLADALLRAEERHGAAVLIAGNGHVRRDRGVPWYIRQREPDAKILSVLLLEVEDGKTDPAAYVPRDPDGKAAADLVFFTPRAKRDDPCQAFRK